MIVKDSVKCYVASWRGMFLQGGRAQSIWNSEAGLSRSLPHGYDVTKVKMVEYLESIGEVSDAAEILGAIYSGKYNFSVVRKYVNTDSYKEFDKNHNIKDFIEIKEIANVPTANPLQP